MPGESLLSWTLDHVRLDGRPISFMDYPFAVGLYRVADERQRIVLKKSAQCGGSVWGAIESLYQADVHGLKVIYFFPTDEHVRPHVKEKVNPIIQASPYLRKRVYDPGAHLQRVENVHVKRVGAGWTRYRGAKSVHARQSTPADLCILDERDRFEPAWIPDIEKRLHDSRLKLWREICVPTFIGAPIDAAYDESDQRVWMVRCGHCWKLQDLDWTRDVVAQEGEHAWSLRDTGWSPEAGRDIQVFCRHCGKDVDRLSPGTWVPRHPNRETAGVHINRLMTRSATVRELWDTFRSATERGDETAIQGFYNGDLGLAYTPQSAGLSDALLDACKRRYRMPVKILDRDQVCTAGFDVQEGYLVGRVSQIVRTGGVRFRRAVWIGRTTWNELPSLLARFPVRACVIDGEYDTTKAKEAQAAGRGIWLCRYPGNQRPDAPWIQVDHVDRWLTVDRTQSLDRSHAEILLEHNLLPANASQIPDFYVEMKSAVRVIEETPKGKRSAWRKGAKPDDARHADNYDYIAAELLELGLASKPVALPAGPAKKEAALAKVHPKRRFEPDHEAMRRQLEQPTRKKKREDG